MKRITVPEPKIELYKDGFQGHDKLGREETGRKLSELAERIDEPLVIALDGAWGSGKSFFLKCWVGYHQQQEAHKAETVYFDAFKHDYLDEPLIALTKAIADRLPPDTRGRKFIQSSKKIASKLAMPALRVTGAAVTGGVTELTGAVVDGVIKSGWKEAEKAAQEFWNTHTAKTAAMEQFRSALEQLTQPNTKGEPQNKLVIVVDELDRCRPDYALSLLEIIKHFFNVPGVHFVLGVNLSELQNSVKARYGTEVDSDTYLQKFISIRTELPKQFGYGEAVAIQHFHRSAQTVSLGGQITHEASQILEKYTGTKELTPRLMERLVTALALVPAADVPSVHHWVLVQMAIAKVCQPELYAKFRTNTVELADIVNFVRMEPFERDQWQTILERRSNVPTERSLQSLMSEPGLSPRLLPNLCRDYLDTLSEFS